MHLSACAYHRTQSAKLARTIADLCPATGGSGYWAGSEPIQTAHVAEAIQ
jgi:hypothetical protein